MQQSYVESFPCLARFGGWNRTRCSYTWTQICNVAATPWPLTETCRFIKLESPAHTARQSVCLRKVTGAAWSERRNVTARCQQGEQSDRHMWADSQLCSSTWSLPRSYVSIRWHSQLLHAWSFVVTWTRVCWEHFWFSYFKLIDLERRRKKNKTMTRRKRLDLPNCSA